MISAATARAVLRKPTVRRPSLSLRSPLQRISVQRMQFSLQRAQNFRGGMENGLCL
jgi:hypothetical protein